MFRISANAERVPVNVAKTVIQFIKHIADMELILYEEEHLAGFLHKTEKTFISESQHRHYYDGDSAHLIKSYHHTLFILPEITFIDPEDGEKETAETQLNIIIMRDLKGVRLRFNGQTHSPSFMHVPAYKKFMLDCHILNATLLNAIKEHWIPSLEIEDDMFYIVPQFSSSEYVKIQGNSGEGVALRYKEICETYKNMDVHTILQEADWDEELIFPPDKRSGRVKALQQRMNKHEEKEYPVKQRIEKIVALSVPLFKGIEW